MKNITNVTSQISHDQWFVDYPANGRVTSFRAARLPNPVEINTGVSGLMDTMELAGISSAGPAGMSGLLDQF